MYIYIYAHVHVFFFLFFVFFNVHAFLHVVVITAITGMLIVECYNEPMAMLGHLIAEHGEIRHVPFNLLH